MARKRYKNLDKEPATGLFGFAWDAFKVIIKPLPDEDQSLGEFIMEKLGALALLVGSLFLIGVLVFVIFHEIIFDMMT